MAESNICLHDNFFLAFSRVLTILLSGSTLVPVGGGETEMSNSDVDWLLWKESRSSTGGFSAEGNSPGALEGLIAKSEYVGSPFSPLILAAFDDLKGSNKPFFLILVCVTASFPGSSSSLSSLVAGSSDLCSFTGMKGSTRGMCRSLRDCLVVASLLPCRKDGGVGGIFGGKEIGRLPPHAPSPSLKTTLDTAGVLLSAPVLMAPATGQQ